MLSNWEVHLVLEILQSKQKVRINIEILNIAAVQKSDYYLA